MEFYYFMKKELDNYEDFAEAVAGKCSSKQVLSKLFTTSTGKPALKPLFNKITPKQVFSVNIAKFL